VSDLLHFIEAAAAEVPEEVGKALTFIGEEVAKLGQLCETLAARMDKLDPPATP